MFFNKSNMKEKTIATLLACMENLSKQTANSHHGVFGLISEIKADVFRLQGIDQQKPSSEPVAITVTNGNK